jgi:hypothetical protein
LSISVLYVSIVGDWMFGFRFFVHLMPLAALMLALAISIVFRARPGAAWAATIAVVISCTMAAAAFERQYEAEEERQSWWRSRSFDERQLSRVATIVPDLEPTPSAFVWPRLVEGQRWSPPAEEMVRIAQPAQRGPSRDTLKNGAIIGALVGAASSMVLKITFSTNSPNKITVKRPANTSGMRS